MITRKVVLLLIDGFALCTNASQMSLDSYVKLEIVKLTFLSGKKVNAWLAKAKLINLIIVP